MITSESHHFQSLQQQEEALDLDLQQQQQQALEMQANNSVSGTRLRHHLLELQHSLVSLRESMQINQSLETNSEREERVGDSFGWRAGQKDGGQHAKQYLPLVGQPIALYSFYTFSQMIEVKEIIVVCDPSYRDVFEDAKPKIQKELKFTLPGKERQDSVYSGLQAIDLTSELICIHDSARPLVSSGDVEKVLKDGCLNGAAVLGVPVKATIKEANSESYVVKTLDRRTLWEMQTPQGRP